MLDVDGVSPLEHRLQRLRAELDQTRRDLRELSERMLYLAEQSALNNLAEDVRQLSYRVGRIES